MPPEPPRIVVAVCKGSECCDRGADALVGVIERAVKGEGPRVRVTRGGCWGFCNLGANVVVREDAAALAVERNVFGGDASFTGRVGEYAYGACTAESVAKIAAEHLIAGRPVRELLLTAEARKTAVKLSKE